MKWSNEISNPHLCGTLMKRRDYNTAQSKRTIRRCDKIEPCARRFCARRFYVLDMKLVADAEFACHPLPFPTADACACVEQAGVWSK